MAAGDALARADLFKLTRERLLVMTRALMGHFARLRRWVESEDVLQGALVRLDRALEQIAPDSTGAFLALASRIIRRELLDLVRHYFGAHGLGANHGTPPDPAARVEEAAGTNRDDPTRLAEWAELHELIGELPDKKQEVVLLRVYHGLTVPETARVLAVSESTVKRLFVEAKKWLGQRLSPEFSAEIDATE